MKQVTLSFSGRLAEFLPASRRNRPVALAFRGRQTAKHLVESAGAPHTEVGQLRVGRQPVDFNYLPRDGDRIEVLPATPKLDQLSGLHRDGRLTIRPCFLLDNHLGRLAALLRMLGFDCLYPAGYQDEDLARAASQEQRILLTRDRRLLMRKAIHYGYCVRSLEPDQQACEILERFALDGLIKPFQRCLRCNTPLEPVEKSAILDRLEPLTRRYYDQFHHCPACGQIYWKGSHYEKMLARLERLLTAGAGSSA